MPRIARSLASCLQGEPRATHDIDVVIEFDSQHTDDLIAIFPPPRFCLSRLSIEDAIQSAGMFNLLDVDGGEKVDFWLLTDDPFDESRFARRRTDKYADISVVVSSPEDTILAKLRWAEKSGGSEKQFGDALRIFEVQGSTMVIEYLEEWIERLGLQSWWKRLQVEAEIIDLGDV